MIGVQTQKRSMLQGLVDRLSSPLHTLGRRNGLWYLLSRALERGSGGRVRLIRYLLVAQPLPEGPPARALRDPGVTVREAGPGDPLLQHLPHPAAVIRGRFAQGARCLAVVRGADPMAFLWWTEGPYEEDEVRCRFEPAPEGEAVWDFDVFVFPHHRFGTAFARLWGEAGARLRQRGYRASCSRISAFNAASVASHRRLGARVTGMRTFLVLGPLQVSWGRGRPGFHVSLRDAARPRVRVPSRAV